MNLVRDVVVPDLHEFLLLFKGPPNFNSEKKSLKYLSYWTTRLEYLEYLCSANLLHQKDGLLSLLYLLLQFMLKTQSTFNEDLQEPFENLMNVLNSISSHLHASSDFEQYLPNLQETLTETSAMNLFFSDFHDSRLEILGCHKTLLLLVEIVQSFLNRNTRELKQNLENPLSLNYFLACQNQQKASFSLSDSIDHSVTPSDSLFHFSLLFKQILIMELRHGFFLENLLRNCEPSFIDSLPSLLLTLLQTDDTLSFEILEQALLEIRNTVFYPNDMASSSLILRFLFIIETLLRSNLQLDSLLELHDQPVTLLSANCPLPNPFQPLLSDSSLLPDCSVLSVRFSALLDSLSSTRPPLIGSLTRNRHFPSGHLPLSFRTSS